MPALPLILLYTALGLRALSPSPAYRRRWLAALALSNATAVMFLGTWYQSAPIDVMRALRAEASAGRLRRAELLTYCHQTPAYSHLHVHPRAYLSMLRCPPPGLGRLVGPAILDGDEKRIYAGHSNIHVSRSLCANECDCFFERFGEAMKRRLRSRSSLLDTDGLPSHVVLFEEDCREEVSRDGVERCCDADCGNAVIAGSVCRHLRRLGFTVIGVYFHEVYFDASSLLTRRQLLASWLFASQRLMRVRCLLLLRRVHGSGSRRRF